MASNPPIPQHPSPIDEPAAQAVEPLLDKPASIGGGTFGKGVPVRLLVAAAQRQYERKQQEAVQTPEERVEEERRRRGLWDMLNGPLGLAHPQQAADERGTLTAAASDVLAERQRQRTKEGWTLKHDDEHDDNSLAKAAACYALYMEPVKNIGDVLRFWPKSWSVEYWKPKDRRRNLVRAAAMLIAEIERLDRAALKASQKGGQ